MMGTETSQMEFLETDFTSWEIGPYHGSLPGPMKIKLKLDGEVIVSAAIESGFLHRGLEKTFELHPWFSAVTYADHLDPEGAVFGELALCQAVEDLAGIKLPERAQAIRVIVSELTRISCHLGFIARMARAVKSDTTFHYVLRDREKFLDLIELLTGARFSLNFLRFGGVSADVTEGFMERVLEAGDLIRIRLKEYNDLFSFNHAFLKRTSGIGVLSLEMAKRLAITGPNARASGISFDIRKVHPYSGYEKKDFDVPVAKEDGSVVGDSHTRFLMRLREISQSAEILKQSVESIPFGEFASEKVQKDFKVASGEAYSRIESSRGLLGCYVVSDGSTKPARVQFNTPSLHHLCAVPHLLVGARIEDLPVILASMDIGIAEVDR